MDYNNYTRSHGLHFGHCKIRELLYNCKLEVMIHQFNSNTWNCCNTSLDDAFTECKLTFSMKPSCLTCTGTRIQFQNQSAACATTHSSAKLQAQRSPLTEPFHQCVSEGWLYGVMGEGHAPVKGSTEKTSCRALAPCPASAQWPVSPDTTTQLIIQHHIHLSPALGNATQSTFLTAIHGKA